MKLSGKLLFFHYSDVAAVAALVRVTGGLFYGALVDITVCYYSMLGSRSTSIPLAFIPGFTRNGGSGRYF